MPPSRGRGNGKSKPQGSRPQHQQVQPPTPREFTPPPSALDDHLLTTSTLLDQSQFTSDQWYHSSKTRKGYANYVKAGKKWLEEWSAEKRAEGGTELLSAAEEQSASASPNSTNLTGAFDKISDITPVALRLLTAYKCEHLGRSFSTAEGIRSAFKDYFERVHGCQGETWRFNRQTREWDGNPVFQADYKVYFESLKNRDNRLATTSQALPMLPGDMKAITAYLNGSGAQEYSETRRLFFIAFATTAFTLWSRTDELINLQVKHVRLSQCSPSGKYYHEIHLVYRKTNKDPTKGQLYQVPPQTTNPEIDCFTSLSAWFAHMETLLQRPLSPQDYIFPALDSAGRIKFGERLSRSAFETLMDGIVERSGVLQGRNGRFTTHCFRRGGAQYRFMWAPHKWSLKAVKWWGGWSTNENVGTVMRYLLDELMAYEEGFSDIMMDDRRAQRHETFMGDSAVPDSPTLLLRSSFAALEATLTARIDELLTPVATRFLLDPATDLMPRLPALTLTSPPSPMPQSRCANLDETDPALPHLSLSSSSLPPRIPTVHTMDDVVRLWEKGDQAKGVDIPLSEWYYNYETCDYTPSESVKFSNLRIVYEEYSIIYHGDAMAFRRGYPGLWSRYTKLRHAICEARMARGETKPRKRKGSSR